MGLFGKGKDEAYRTYHLEDQDGYTVTSAIWDQEGADLAQGRSGSHFAYSSGGRAGHDMTLSTFDADADAKFRAECEARGISFEIRPDLT